MDMSDFQQNAQESIAAGTPKTFAGDFNRGSARGKSSAFLFLLRALDRNSFGSNCLGIEDEHLLHPGAF
jgi:hypothetical protein